MVHLHRALMALGAELRIAVMRPFYAVSVMATILTPLRAS